MAYLVKTGVSYRVNGVEVYREPGKVVSDLPPGLAAIFLSDGCIEEVSEPKKAAPRKKV